VYIIEETMLPEEIIIPRKYVTICDKDLAQACILAQIEETIGYADRTARATIDSISKTIEGTSSTPTIKKALENLSNKGFISVVKLAKSQGMEIKFNRDHVSRAIKELR